MAEMTAPGNDPGSRTVVANIHLSLDGRVNGPGEHDMSRIVPHVLTGGPRPDGESYQPWHHGAAGPQELLMLRILR
jgi:hypothetical protein